MRTQEALIWILAPQYAGDQARVPKVIATDDWNTTQHADFVFGDNNERIVDLRWEPIDNQDHIADFHRITVARTANGPRHVRLQPLLKQGLTAVMMQIRIVALLERA